MKRLSFDSQGKLVEIDGEYVSGSLSNNQKQVLQLKTSDSLDFLKEEKTKLNNIFDKSYWSLYENNAPLEPLKFSNGKTQEDVVKEIYSLIKQGEKIIFLHGACGTGKSAIALNLARLLGKTSIVVPVKTLQSQYEKDYVEKKYLLKKTGSKLKIAMITGRDNHDSIIKPGISCADPFLPDTIKITEKNFRQLKEYYSENPFMQNKELNDIEKLRRMSIAPANPYWSPIIPAEFEANQLTDAKKHEYLGCDGKKYIFYHRKQGCSYYDQYLSYKQSDVIIFNSAKYNTEMALGRKPLTELDVIDEADVYLDNFFEQSELNLTWLNNSLKNLSVENKSSEDCIKKMRELIDLEEKNKNALGIDENKIFKIEDTKIKELIQLMNANQELQAEILIDEQNYANNLLEIARDFSSYLAEVFVTFRREEDNLYARVVSTNLSYKMKDLLTKTKALVLMSGTLHSKEVLEHIFQIKNYKVVEAETLSPGNMEIVMTGKEFDCKYSNFSSGKYSREDYLKALHLAIEKSKEPTLVHVHAYQDLPSKEEKIKLNLSGVTAREDLFIKQRMDSKGKDIEDFKKGKFTKLFSTKCSRGVDFPGKTCNSIVFTKYPNPNVQDIFWKVIQQTHPAYYWEFYRDKAKREFLQKLYRAIRSKDDHVYVLSPDKRVLEEVQKLQNNAVNRIQQK